MLTISTVHQLFNLWYDRWIGNGDVGYLDSDIVGGYPLYSHMRFSSRRSAHRKQTLGIYEKFHWETKPFIIHDASILIKFYQRFKGQLFSQQVNWCKKNIVYNFTGMSQKYHIKSIDDLMNYIKWIENLVIRREDRITGQKWCKHSATISDPNLIMEKFIKIFNKLPFLERCCHLIKFDIDELAPFMKQNRDILYWNSEYFWVMIKLHNKGIKYPKIPLNMIIRIFKVSLDPECFPRRTYRLNKYGTHTHVYQNYKHIIENIARKYLRQQCFIVWVLDEIFDIPLEIIQWEIFPYLELNTC